MLYYRSVVSAMYINLTNIYYLLNGFVIINEILLSSKIHGIHVCIMRRFSVNKYKATVQLTGYFLSLRKFAKNDTYVLILL